MKIFLFAVALAATLAPRAGAQDAIIGPDALVTIAAPSPNSLLGNQWVKLSGEGVIAGSVAPLDAATSDLTGEISLFRADDAVAAPLRAPVAADGTFELQAMTAGVFTLLYQADSHFAALALHVLPADSTQASESSLVVAASALSPRRALMTIARYQPVTIEPTSSLVNAALPDGVLLAQSLAKGTHYRVTQNAEGGLDGRLIQAGSSARGLLPAVAVNVMLIQGEELIAQTTTSADGTFQVPALAPGSYSLLASGTDGFAAFGFELIAASEPVAQTNTGGAFRLASVAVQDSANVLEAQLAPANPQVFSTLPPGEDDGAFLVPLGDPGMGPGFAGGGGPFGGGGGGFGGGGGGFGGGGGGGGALGLAAIGGLIAAIIASDDDDDDFDAEPLSPAQP